MTARKGKDQEAADWSTGAGEVFIATTQPLSTGGTAGTFEFCSARPHYIPSAGGLWKLPAPCTIRTLPGS
ncbi:MAG: hypothetical protein NTZ51_08315 [Proteobacteria bacterium]|nr:hypothetical protein [Pseudomonadota bacterium]